MSAESASATEGITDIHSNEGMLLTGVAEPSPSAETMNEPEGHPRNGWLDRFFFASCDPSTVFMLRVLYGILLTIYTLVWMVDGTKWFSDQGVMSIETAKLAVYGPRWSILYWSSDPTFVQCCLAVLLVNAICLTVGLLPRAQAVMIFFWLVSFQNRNPLIGDGEDTVFRMFAFFMIFLPLGQARLSSCCTKVCDYSLMEKCWALRLFQLQMTLIYVSAAWSKVLGSTWQDGSALFYVYQLGDLYGRGWLPEFLVQSEAMIRFSTWAVVVVEAVLPILLWYPRTRKLGIALGVGLHLLMEYSMNLFLFQWVMILGVLSFWQPRSRQQSLVPSDGLHRESNAVTHSPGLPIAN